MFFSYFNKTIIKGDYRQIQMYPGNLIKNYMLSNNDIIIIIREQRKNRDLYVQVFSIIPTESIVTENTKER